MQVPSPRVPLNHQLQDKTARAGSELCADGLELIRVSTSLKRSVVQCDCGLDAAAQPQREMKHTPASGSYACTPASGLVHHVAIAIVPRALHTFKLKLQKFRNNSEPYDVDGTLDLQLNSL
jgi:hypothetical protein